jgi:HD-GYP domain-containing protein (c-di-GMP phosphodiesterase class II)
MVRFTEIINLEDERDGAGGSEAEVGDGGSLFTNSQLIKLERGPLNQESQQDPSAEYGRPEIIECHQRLFERAGEIEERVKKNQGISPSPILAHLHHVIDKDLVDDLYDYVMLRPWARENLQNHTVGVTIASLKMGKGMGYDMRGFLELGLSSFLENVGMYKIPHHILDKEEGLSKEEMAMIRRHPELSYQILSRMGRQYRWLAEIALQVHERTDGSGYPRGLSGGEILELASIIGLMDTYLAMIRDRPYRKGLLQPDAVKYIVMEAKGLFPSKVLKVFLHQISLYPVNTIVRLNNQYIGRVISTVEKQPLRPRIALLYDNLGKKVRERDIIELTENPLLYIKEGLDERDLPNQR